MDTEYPKEKHQCYECGLDKRLKHVVEVVGDHILERVQWVIVCNQQYKQEHDPLLYMTQVIIVEFVDLSQVSFNLLTDRKNLMAVYAAAITKRYLYTVK